MTEASSVLGTNAANKVLDGDTAGADSRWESEHGIDGVWITVEAVTVYQMRICWEAASAKEYEVSFLLTGEEGSRVSV